MIKFDEISVRECDCVQWLVSKWDYEGSSPGLGIELGGCNRGPCLYGERAVGMGWGMRRVGWFTRPQICLIYGAREGVFS